jgi:hypothetical protein
MAEQTNNHSEEHSFSWRIIGWSIPVLLLLVPWIARFPWTLSDFIVVGALFGAAGLVIELAVRASSNLAYRLGACLAVLACFLLIWVNLAVGFLGDEDNPANLMFGAVLAIAVGGAIVTGFKASGMAGTMFVTAAAQLLAGLIGLAAGLGSPGFAGVYEVALGSTLFCGMWIIAGALFRKAADS